MAREQLQQLISGNFIDNILVMLKNLVLTLPLGLVCGIVSIVAIKYCEDKGIIKRKKKNIIALFLSYIVIIVQMSILFRPFGTIKQIDLVPFNMPGGVRYIVLYVLANMIAFLPVGILAPMIWNKMRNIKKVVLIGFFMSLFIEVSQLALQCGVFQTEDLIANALGAGIGYYIYKKIVKKQR